MDLESVQESPITGIRALPPNYLQAATRLGSELTQNLALERGSPAQTASGRASTPYNGPIVFPGHVVGRNDEAEWPGSVESYGAGTSRRVGFPGTEETIRQFRSDSRTRGVSWSRSAGLVPKGRICADIWGYCRCFLHGQSTWQFCLLADFVAARTDQMTNQSCKSGHWTCGPMAPEPVREGLWLRAVRGLRRALDEAPAEKRAARPGTGFQGAASSRMRCRNRGYGARMTVVVFYIREDELGHWVERKTLMSYVSNDYQPQNVMARHVL